jgi:TetR/AcrR family transcriptional regulator, transcriptional repressor for nem operon
MGRIRNGRQRLMHAVLELLWTGSYGSTTIDQICEKAQMSKGSFYYFFDSKAELAVEALDAGWQSMRAELDGVFSQMVSPLERICKYCKLSYKTQQELKRKYGRVLGSPQFCLGAEVRTLEGRLQKKIQEILNYKRRYFESAVRDAHTAGIIHAPDPDAKARMILAYCEGLLTQARIQNDVEVLQEAVSGIFAMLGVKELVER